jgi:hypothetical protein
MKSIQRIVLALDAPGRSNVIPGDGLLLRHLIHGTPVLVEFNKEIIFRHEKHPVWIDSLRAQIRELGLDEPGR